MYYTDTFYEIDLYSYLTIWKQINLILDGI